MAEDWTYTEFLDKNSGKSYRTYKYKRKPCLRIPLKSKLCDQLAGYSLIHKDLKSVLVWAEIIQSLQDGTASSELYKSSKDREKYNHIKGIFVAALTFYGKCFSKCDGRPVKLERKQVPEALRQAHDICISYRHNFAAHSGDAGLEAATVALALPVRSKRGTDSPKSLFIELRQPDLVWHSKDGENDFVKLFEHMRDFVKAKIDFLTKKIYEDEVFVKADEFWRNR
ncbi:hypothetical protein PFLL34_04623 [Pseudomonas fluorescens]|uniref:hypothetical protein n=1 Tax=Pseudomonas TaxID=286 RepID=UPI00076DAAB4|nr:MULTISPECIES: hypothetical protein [Pseudomonas]KWV78098.1 hypothetical protein PFLL34_04623 [Pseudomonas fluorescens]